MDQTALYVLVFLVAAISLVAIGISVAYFLLFQKYKAYREESLARHKDEADQFSKALESAKSQALLILDQAQTAAKEIVARADAINKENTNNLSTLVESNLQRHQASYDAALGAISTNITKTFTGLPQTVNTQVSAEVSKLISNLDSEMKALTTQVRTGLHEPYEKALKDAEDYKKVRIQAFENQLFTLLNIISKEVLRRELTIEQHEKLVTKALQQAKEEGLL